MRIRTYALMFLVIFLSALACSCGDSTVGVSVTFGSYYNDNSETKSGIEWTVVEKKNGSVYLMTSDIIDCVPYDIDSGRAEKGSVWKDSYIRRWLNEDFYDTAFTDEEKAIINETDITVKYYPKGIESKETEKSTDRVFLLSDKQAKKLAVEQLAAPITKYASEKYDSVSSNMDNGAWNITNVSGSSTDIGKGTWWIMSPGSYYYGSCVDRDGVIHSVECFKLRYYECIDNYAACVGVRPVISMKYEDYINLIK